MKDTTHNESDTVLEEPIKESWTGYARGRISEYNAGFKEESGIVSPRRFDKVVGRHKTLIEIRTVEEADYFRYEMTNYNSNGRIWMNAAMDRSLRLVAEKVDQGMEKRGYTPTWEHREYIRIFKGYEKE